MYLFSISIDEHVPLNMGTGRTFFQGEANNGFSRGGPKIFLKGAEVVKLHFHHSKLRKQYFCKKFIEKRQISKSYGGLGSTSNAYAPKTCCDKKLEKANKNIFTSKDIMIFLNNHHRYLL